MSRPLRRLSALLVAALAAASLTVSTAEARGGAAPVTAPDSVSGLPGEYLFVKVLANDADPEGDRLAVCGLTPLRQAHLRADFDDPKEVAVGLGGRARPGTYVFTYYACDGTSQTPGTLTVVVEEPPKIKVRAVRNAVDRVRATSDAPFRVKLSYGDPGDDLEGRASIPRRGSVVFSTRLDAIYWVARTRDGTLLARGHVYNIP